MSEIPEDLREEIEKLRYELWIKCRITLEVFSSKDENEKKAEDEKC